MWNKEKTGHPPVEMPACIYSLFAASREFQPPGKSPLRQDAKATARPAARREKKRIELLAAARGEA